MLFIELCILHVKNKSVSQAQLMLFISLGNLYVTSNNVSQADILIVHIQITQGDKQHKDKMEHIFKI